MTLGAPILGRQADHTNARFVVICFESRQAETGHSVAAILVLLQIGRKIRLLYIGGNPRNLLWNGLVKFGPTWQDAAVGTAS